jgi:hypothetical protein
VCFILYYHLQKIRFNRGHLLTLTRSKATRPNPTINAVHHLHALWLLVDERGGSRIQ